MTVPDPAFSGDVLAGAILIPATALLMIAATAQLRVSAGQRGGQGTRAARSAP